jgi:hypothetical protein
VLAPCPPPASQLGISSSFITNVAAHRTATGHSNKPTGHPLGPFIATKVRKNDELRLGFLFSYRFFGMAGFPPVFRLFFDLGYWALALRVARPRGKKEEEKDAPPHLTPNPTRPPSVPPQVVAWAGACRWTWPIGAVLGDG